MNRGNAGDQIDQVLEEMESDHDRLLQTVDSVRGALSTEDINLAKKHMMQLQIFQQSHFEHEARLMERHEYPYINDHKTTHDNLNEALYSINKLVNLENLQHLSGELTTYLENSMEHIIEVDRPFQEFLAAFRDGNA